MRYEEFARETGIKFGMTLASGTAVGKFFGFLNEWGVGIGVLLTLIFGVVGWYYKDKDHQRKEREDERLQLEHEARMRSQTT